MLPEARRQTAFLLWSTGPINGDVETDVVPS
jgi:hypothetical protein